MIQTYCNVDFPMTILVCYCICLFGTVYKWSYFRERSQNSVVVVAGLGGRGKGEFGGCCGNFVDPLNRLKLLTPYKNGMIYFKLVGDQEKYLHILSKIVVLCLLQIINILCLHLLWHLETFPFQNWDAYFFIFIVLAYISIFQMASLVSVPTLRLESWCVGSWILALQICTVQEPRNAVTALVIREKFACIQWHQRVSRWCLFSKPDINTGATII